MNDFNLKRTDGPALINALAYALARAQLPTPMETSRDYAERIAPLVLESGYVMVTALQVAHREPSSTD